MKNGLSAFVSFLILMNCSWNVNSQKLPPLPKSVLPYVKSVTYGKLKDYHPAVRYTVLSRNMVHVQVSWNLPDSVRQDDLQINIIPDFKPVFSWAPHLTPTGNHIIAQHVLIF
jgi:hypothetical protein